jgi:hypothetical protein
MWGKADELRLTVLMGLRKGLSLVRGMRRSLTEEEQHKIAGAIVEHLEQSNWKIEDGPAYMLQHFVSEHHFEHRLAQKIVGDRRPLNGEVPMIMQERFGGTFAEMVAAALGDFASATTLAGYECDAQKIWVDIAPAPHRPTGLPAGRMATYCFFLNGRALKIGIAGPNSDPRYRSHHYSPTRAPSTLARSILKHPNKIGITAIPAGSIGDWIKANTDRINLLLPASYGKAMLSQLEAFLHARWNPLYEGRVLGH